MFFPAIALPDFGSAATGGFALIVLALFVLLVILSWVLLPWIVVSKLNALRIQSASATTATIEELKALGKKIDTTNSNLVLLYESLNRPPEIDFSLEEFTGTSRRNGRPEKSEKPLEREKAPVVIAEDEYFFAQEGKTEGPYNESFVILISSFLSPGFAKDRPTS
jgi:hypothetical protein